MDESKDNAVLTRDDVKVGFVISGFLTSKECTTMIETAEKKGFETLPAERHSKDMRTNTRIRSEDEVLATLLWTRLEPYLKESDKIVDCLETKTKWRACGLNPSFRYCKYIPGQFFVRHIDGQVMYEEKRSFKTAMIYLNTVAEGSGGGTRFYSHNGKNLFIDYVYKPMIGDLFCFAQDQEHDGEILTQGTKYIMRSEIMYTPLI